MSEEIYRKLAQHLDRLPGGFPPTEDGLELRILRRLFTPQQAELATHLTLLREPTAVIARRAGQPVDETQALLDEMSEKGLIYDTRPADGPPLYMAAQFVVGIWEFQVDKLTPELIHDVDLYLERVLDPQLWRATPQLRTVPINAEIPAPAEVLPYEDASALVRARSRFAVAPCICRKERQMIGEACDKPLEVCLSMDGAADFYVRHGMGRSIEMSEALEILELANETGLVLQPANDQRAGFICCCCGDCCGVLRNIKRFPQPGTLVSSPYYAESDAEICSACETCLGRCPMEAIQVNGYAVVDRGRCIGCGLCVATCETGALHLQRKPDEEQSYVPKNLVESTLRLARQRGVTNNTDLVMMAVRSKVDRLRASR